MISRGEEDSAFRRGYDGGFTAGFHSRDELLREVLELTDTTKRELYRQTPVRALLTLAVLGNKLQTALKEE